MEERPAKVLVVDDQPQAAEMIREEVSAAGFDCVACSDPVEAMRHIGEGGFDVVVTDITMPKLSGMDLLARLRQHTPECKVILITGHSTQDYLGQALMLGAFDYIEKPFDPIEVADLVRRAVGGNDEVAPLPARAAALTQPGFQARQASLDSVGALVRAIEAKDPYTRRHSEHVAHYAMTIGEAMGLGGEELESLRAASLLHDVGKIGVPDHILTKPGPLTAKEFKHIRRHPALGEAILSKITAFKREAMVIRYHHERWDGAGYPDRLAGEGIPKLSRLICVADCMDAMLMTRTYKESYTPEKMIGELTCCASTQFDPEIAAAAVGWCRENLDELILPDKALRGACVPAV